MEDFAERMAAVVNYKRTGEHKPGWGKNKQKTTLNQCNTHVLRGGVLYYRGSVKNPGPLREVITTVERVQEILRHNHSVPMGGHSGVTATVKKISKHYWWNGIQRDVEAFISTCEACQCFEKLKTQAPTLKQIVVVEPLELVGIDLIGPLPLTNQGHRYVLTMTDYFTKWVDMYPLATKEAKGVCSAIKTFITRWGAPKRILSDQGKEFVNQLNKEVCNMFGIRRSVTSAYHPQCNGLDERTNQTFKTRLGKLVDEHGLGWDTFLDDVAYSLRIQDQASTKFSPFFFMFGRHPRQMLQLCSFLWAVLFADTFSV
ncbi:hypothetical protein V1264_025122 [Littorina saxatilis]|uniref:Integrase catalytic domain-containing protein n=1 Tax=Littorina saxatilis TaxID=31220 RepID=A0AAN9FZA4_9CAEN